MLLVENSTFGLFFHHRYSESWMQNKALTTLPKYQAAISCTEQPSCVKNNLLKTSFRKRGRENSIPTAQVEFIANREVSDHATLLHITLYNGTL